MYLCHVCLQNNHKVYFCKKIDVTLILSIMAKEKSDGIAKVLVSYDIDCFCYSL